MSETERTGAVRGFQVLTGRRFGRLVVLTHIPESGIGDARWLCQCDCGQTKVVSGKSLRQSHTRSCGCLRNERKPPAANGRSSARFIDLTGKTFNRLTVIECVRRGTQGKPTIWRCLCSCGNGVSVSAPKLKRGETKSCGCLRDENRISHGLSHTREFATWNNMLKRCRSSDVSTSELYKNRGIVVCEGWKTSFLNFLADMGERPPGDISIDRKDGQGNYSCGHCDECISNGWPANCRWATDREQVVNRRVTIFVERHGQRLCLMDWALIEGIKYGTVQGRLRRGWDVERALTEPVHR